MLFLFLSALNEWNEVFTELKVGNIEKVKKLIKTKLDEDNSRAHMIMALLLIFDQPDLAYNHLKKADINDSNTLNLLGMYHRMKGNMEESLKYFQKSWDKGNLFGLSNLGSHYQLMGLLDKSDEFLRLGIKKGLTICAFMLGENYLKRKNFIDGYMWAYIAHTYISNKTVEYETKSARDHILKVWPFINGLVPDDEKKEAINKAQEWMKQHPNTFITKDQEFENVYGKIKQ